MKKRKIGNIILIVVIALIAALLVLIPYWTEKNAQTETDDTSKLSTKVETATVTDTVAGNGSITEPDAVDVTIPAEVKLTGYLVSNGDTVSEGDPLATVDKVTVMNAIVKVREDLEEIESDMADAQEETAETELKTEVAGRVKLVYAQAGDNVRTVMDEYGSLALVSLDGLMVTEIESDAVVTAGTSCTVFREDGVTVIDGTVELCRNGVVTVTVTDEDTLIGETVTVFTDKGVKIGKGTLSVHSAWNVTAWSGTVKKVNCVAEQSVKANALLFRLEDTSYTSEYSELSEKHREYEELLNELVTLYSDGVIYATADGKIDGIDEDNTDILLTSATEDGDLTVESLANESSSGSSFGETVKMACVRIGRILSISGGLKDGSEPSGQTNDGGDGGDGDNDTKTYAVSPDTTTPDTHTNYAAVITKFENDTYTVRYTSLSMEETDKYSTKSFSVPDSKEELAAWSSATVSITAIQYDSETDTWPEVSIAVGSKLILVDGVESYTWAILRGSADLTDINPDSGSDTPGGGGGGGGGGSFPSFGSYSSAQTEETYTYFSTDPVTVMSIIPQDTVSVTMSIDELDILSVSLGQEAQVTLDAVPGQSFTGTVTKIETKGSNSGGNTKFTVTMELDRTEQMVSGMNVSALLTVDTHENVLTVPTEALVEEGNKTYVYTAYDEEDGLSGKVEVTTGASDGLVTEILSGLKEGDTVWYAYYDTLQIERDFASGSSGSFSISSMFGGSGGGGGMTGGGGGGGGMGGGHGGR